MKLITWLIALAVITIVFFACAVHAQTLQVTNGNSVLTVSNGVVVSTASLQAPEPALVSTNGQVVQAAFVQAIAQATGIPTAVLSVVPLKGLFWLFILSVGVPVAARWLRKLVPDDLQTGAVGTALKHAALEINPNLTPTPPTVEKPAVVLTDQSTGAKVEPETVPQPPTKPAESKT